MSTEITCSPPAAADDSGVLVSAPVLTVGGQAVYSCHEGRRLVGLSMRKCLSTGLWEGSQPVCECKYLLIKYKMRRHCLRANKMNHFQGSNAASQTVSKTVAFSWSMKARFMQASPNITVYRDSNVRDISAGDAVPTVDGLVPFLSALVIPGTYNSKVLSFNQYCISEEGKPLPPLLDNGLDSLSSERQSGAAGIWIGVGTGIILVLLLIASLLYCKV